MLKLVVVDVLTLCFALPIWREDNTKSMLLVFFYAVNKILRYNSVKQVTLTWMNITITIATSVVYPRIKIVILYDRQTF